MRVNLQAAPSQIVRVTVACTLAGLLSLVPWMLTGSFAWVRFFFDYPGAIFLAGMPIAGLWFSSLALRSFSPGEPMRLAWLLIAMAATCQAAGSLFAHILATPSLVNPLVWTHSAEPARLQHFRQFGLALAGPVEMALLAAGLFFAVRVCRKTGMLASLKQYDWGLLAAVGAFTVYQLYQVGIAVRAGKQMNALDVITLANDPLLCLLMLEAVLLRRSVAALGRGLIGRCWGAFVAAIALTSLGDMGLWATAYEYIQWPYTAITWFFWYPAAAAYVIAPAYQVAAECHARRSDPAFNGYDPYPSLRVPS